MRLERMRSRVSSSGAWRRTSSSKVALASSIMAQSSPPLVSTPASENSAGSTRRSSLPSSGRPSESASRLAGSIVSTATFFPRAAIPTAIAAELVVFPTPPEPAQMQTRLPWSSSATPAIQLISPESSPASSRISSTPTSGSNMNGRVRSGAWTSSASRASCSCWALARRLSLSAARHAPRTPPLACVRHSLDPFELRPAEPLRVEAVHVDPVDRDADVLDERPLQCRRLVDGHLLGEGDDRHTRLAMVDDERLEGLRLGLDRADSGDVGERPRGLEERDAVPCCRSVDDHEVVLASLLDLAIRLGHLPDLSDRDQLAQSGRGRGEVGEDPGAKQHVPHRSDSQLEQDVLAHRLVGIDGDRPEVLRHLDLVEADLGAMEDA